MNALVKNKNADDLLLRRMNCMNLLMISIEDKLDSLDDYSDVFCCLQNVHCAWVYSIWELDHDSFLDWVSDFHLAINELNWVPVVPIAAAEDHSINEFNITIHFNENPPWSVEAGDTVRVRSLDLTNGVVIPDADYTVNSFISSITMIGGLPVNTATMLLALNGN